MQRQLALAVFAILFIFALCGFSAAADTNTNSSTSITNSHFNTHIHSPVSKSNSTKASVETKYNQSDSQNPDPADLDVFKNSDAVTFVDPTTRTSTASANYGDINQWYIWVTNNGPDPAVNVNLIDVLPNGLALYDPNSFYDPIVPAGTFNASSRTWTIDSVDSGVTYELIFWTEVKSTGSLTNTAFVYSDIPDPDFSNNVWTVNLDVPPLGYSNVNLSKQFHGYDFTGLDPIGLGPVISQTNFYDWVWGVITVTNSGPDYANVIVQDTSSNWTYYDPVFWPDQWAFDDGNGYVWYNTNFDAITGIWTFTIPGNSTYNLAILGYISGTGTANNTATQTYQDNFNPDFPLGPPYGISTSTLTVPAASIIRIGNSTTLPKEFRTSLNSIPITSAHYLDWVWSVITTSNDGPDPVNVVFQDTPIGFTNNGVYAVSYDSGLTWLLNDGSYNPISGLWNINIPTGATRLLALYGQITQTGTITNKIAEISQDTYNPYGPFSQFPNDYPSYTATLNVPLAADIGVSKNFFYEDLGPIVFPDNPLDRYWKFFSEVVVTNNGPDSATNVRIADLLSPGMELAPFDPFGSWFVTYTNQNPDVDPSENNPSFDPVTMIWTIPAMNNGDVWVLDFFTIANTTGNVNNTATFDSVTADQYDWNSTNNVGFAETYVPTAQTQLTKWFQNDSTYGSPHTKTAYKGDNLYAFIKLFNIGPDTAKYITIIDNFTNDLIYDSSMMETSYDGGATWAVDPNAYWLDFGTYSELEWFVNDIPLDGMALFRIPGQVNVSNTTVPNNATETQRTFNPTGNNTDNPPINQPGFNTINATTTLNVPQTPTAIVVKHVSGFKGDLVNLIATLTDTHNNVPIKGKSIQFSVKGNIIGTATTNALGIATLPYTITQNFGTYTILAQFFQDTTYAASSNTNTLNVLDITPPKVTGSSPANNAFNVALNKVIKITFNEVIKFGHNSWIELKLTNGTGAAVPFTSSITGKVLSITPNSLLDAGRKYTVILHSNSITDLAGNGLAKAYTTRFTTAAAPVVTSTSPVNNEVKVVLNKVVHINFSKPIQFGTNPWIEFKNSSGTTKPFTPTITGSRLNLTTTTPLAKGTKYTVIIHSNSVTDLTGTAGLQSPYTTKFTTTTT